MEANCIVQHEVERMEPKREDIILAYLTLLLVLLIGLFLVWVVAMFLELDIKKGMESSPFLHSIRYCSRHPAGCRHH